MENYTVKIWNTKKGIKEYSPDYIFTDVAAINPETALRQVLQENALYDKVYAEVFWNNEQNRQKFEDYALKNIF